jgi:hypothetical protein
MGKFKGFFLDGYCLLKQIGKGLTTSTYLVREVKTGQLMAMVVTPPPAAPWDGRIHYEIKEIPDESVSGDK